MTAIRTLTRPLATRLAVVGCLLSLPLAGLPSQTSAYAAVAQAAAAPVTSTVPWSMLQRDVQQSGHIRLLVRLRVPVQAAGVHTAVSRSSLIAGTRSLLLAALRGHATTSAGPDWLLPVLPLRVDKVGLLRLRASSLITGVEPDSLLRPASVTRDALAGASQAWSLGYMGAGQVVAILDTGVQTSHPYFGGRVVAEACFSGGGQAGQSLCPNGQSTQTGPGSAAPCTVSSACVHGTGMAGVAAGDGSVGGPGFRGVAPQAKIIAAQVFSNTGAGTISAYESDVISGLNWVYSESAGMPIAAVNMSFASESDQFQSACDAQNASMTSAVNTLRGANIATVIATGNGGLIGSIVYPSCISSAVAVGALDATNQIASFANRWTGAMLLAPGVSINSAVPDNGYASFTGTSPAAAVVSGAFAVMRSASPQASVDQMITALRATGHMVTDSASGAIQASIQLDAAVASLPGVVAPTATSVPATASETAMPLPTETATATATPSETATAAPTASSTDTATVTATSTATATATATFSPTATATRHVVKTPVGKSVVGKATPAPAKALRLSVTESPASITVNGYASVSLQTVRGASVNVTVRLQELQTVAVTVGDEKVHSTRLVEIYQTGITGVADELGRYHGRLHITYQPKASTGGTMLVQVHSGQASASHAIKVTISRPKAI